MTATRRATILSLGNCPLDPTLGSGKTRLHWAEGLRQAGFEVDVWDEEKLIQGVPRVGYRFRLAWGAATKPDCRKYDLVECFGSEFGLLTSRLSRKRPRPLIVAHTDGLEPLQSHLTAHLTKPGGLKSKLTAPLHCWLDTAAFRDADALVAGCLADVDFARKLGFFKNGKAVSVNLGVDPEYHGLPFAETKEHRIVYFGTWSERKAPERIVRVMTEVMTRDTDCHFDILGAGGSAKAIMAAFSETLRGRITVYPKLPSADVAKTLLRAKVLFFPSHYEGFGMATSEAMGCGCAAVVTPTGFGADLKDGVDAMVRDFGDERGMEQNLLTLLSDEKLRLKIARAGWERVQLLTWENQRRLLAETYAGWLADWDRENGRFRR